MSYEVDDERLRFIQSIKELGYMNMGDGIEYHGNVSAKYTHFQKRVNGHFVDVKWYW